MADCNLTLLIDNPKSPRKDGEPVTGFVVIRTTGDVKCKGLQVTSYWSTHGRGNIAKGTVEQVTLFQGNWDAGQEYRYPFKVATAKWPPTYYGTYLNVSHFVEARAALPWASDPKQQIEVPVVASTAPDDLQPTVAQGSNGNLGKILLGIFAIVFLIPFLILFTFLIPIVLIGGGAYWFFRVFLPKQLTGNVECSVEPNRLSAGASLRGSLRFTPKRDAHINGIRWKITCEEVCTSGSGSNRSTHRHEVSSRTITLHDAGQLVAGKLQVFDFQDLIPATSPPSLKFSDNEINWVGELRIDIPSWPDFVKEFKLIITPNADAIPSVVTERDDEDEAESADDEEIDDSTDQPNDSDDIFHGTNEPIAAGASSATFTEEETADEGLSFPDVANQILKTQTEPEQLQAVTEAVKGLSFKVRADLQGQMFKTTEAMPVLDGKWVLARHRGSELSLCLLWPPDIQPPRGSVFDWQGTATVIGYDNDHDRLLMVVS